MDEDERIRHTTQSANRFSAAVSAVSSSQTVEQRTVASENLRTQYVKVFDDNDRLFPNENMWWKKVLEETGSQLAQQFQNAKQIAVPAAAAVALCEKQQQRANIDEEMVAAKDDTIEKSSSSSFAPVAAAAAYAISNSVSSIANERYVIALKDGMVVNTEIVPNAASPTVLIGVKPGCDIEAGLSRLHAIVYIFPSLASVLVVDVGSMTGIRTLERSDKTKPLVSSKPEARAVLEFGLKERVVLSLGGCSIMLNPPQCVVCLDKPRCRQFQACLHFVTCADCASKLVECPICRARGRAVPAAALCSMPAKH